MLITRTRPGADRLVKRLQAVGITSTCCPLLGVEHLAGPIEHDPAVQGYILTSAAAIRSLPAPDKLGDIPVYCVGGNTAEQAKASGYKNCIHGTGNGKKLAKLIARKKRTDTGKLLWLRAEIADEAMKRELISSGFDIAEIICYRTRQVTSLAQSIETALANDEFAAVLFHSRRAAQCFCKLAPELGQQTKAVAFSAQITEILQDMEFADVTICKQPNDQAMIATLQDMFLLS